MKKAWIYLENGTLLEGISFGADGSVVAEVAVDRSMIGAQEALADPLLASRALLFMMPEIGNTGANDEDASEVNASAVLVASYQDRYSNFRAKESLGSYLCKHGVLGVSHIDIKAINDALQKNPSLKAVISTTINDKTALQELLEA
ncbi:MAG: carbamoyl-phosphate synthase domain-containing protein [Sulfuricurvum sp.]